jgi:hypothetical protein
VAKLGSIQRKIHVKDGSKYDRVAPELNAPRLKAIAESPAIYLVRSQGDLTLLKQQQDAPVLAPRKHLIGEHHAASQFTTAVGDWAWGAELLIEPYSSHSRLLDSKREEKQRNPTGGPDEQTMWTQAKALEDTAAKSLANLANARIFGTRMATLATALQTPSTFQNTSAIALKNACALAWPKCNAALTVATELSRYLLASANERGLGIFGSYFAEHALVAQTLTRTLLTELGEGIDNIKDQYDDQTAVHLSPVKIGAMLNQVDALIPVVQRLVVAYDGGLNLPGVQLATTGAIQNDDISHLNPLRERYMSRRITAARVPALVKIGAEHVVNLRNNLPPHTLAFDDYNAFRDHNTADNVDIDG